MADEVEAVVEDKVEAEVKPETDSKGDATQALVKERDRREREMRKKHENEQKKLQDQLDALKKQNEDLAKPVMKPDQESAETLQVRMALLEQRFQQKEQDLMGQIARERLAREAAEEAQRQAEKVRLLREAIDQVGVTNRLVAERFFKDSVQWDEVDGKWAYKLLDGKMTAIREGIEYEIPHELKASALKGGTGVSGSAPGGKSKYQKDLETISTEMSTVEREIKLQGASETRLAKYMELQRKKAAVENELSKAK